MKKYLLTRILLVLLVSLLTGGVVGYFHLKAGIAVGCIYAAMFWLITTPGFIKEGDV